MPASGYVTLACVLLLTSRPAFAADPTDPDRLRFESKLHQIAGPEAVDCGRVPPHQDAYLAAACANDQLLMKHAFVMSHHYDWRNVSFYIGFAADPAGNLYQVEFEEHHDYFYFSHGAALGSQNDGDHLGEPYVYVRRCPGPSHIFVRPSAQREFFWLTCEWPESPGLPPNTVRQPLE